MKELLTTLASGDNFSKLLLVILLFVSGGNFFKTGNQGQETRDEVDRQAHISRAQVKAIYAYQRNYINVIKALKADHNKLMEHFGLGPSAIEDPPIPTPLPDENSNF